MEAVEASEFNTQTIFVPLPNSADSQAKQTMCEGKQTILKATPTWEKQTTHERQF